jgi:DNA-binding MarR family transcriptional regulator
MTQTPEILIHRLVRRLQQRNRFVGRSAHNAFTLAEAHVLVELDSAPGRGVSELASQLRIDQSFASRLVQGLAKRKLVLVTRESSDARKKRLSLSASGRGVVRKLDEVANTNYQAMLARVSREDEAWLVWLLKTLSDGFGQAPLEVRPSEVPYRTEQRRFTRCCGLLGDTVFGSKLSATVWQVLGEVVLPPVAPQPGELASLLSLAQNSLSSIVTTMERKKLITRKSNTHDGRGVILRALPAGESVYFEIEALAAERIRNALSDAPVDDVAKATQVFARFLGDTGTGIPPLTPPLVVTAATSMAERSAARGFIARCLVRDNWEQSIPEDFVSSNRHCLTLRLDGALVAALDLDPAAKRIVSCGWNESISPWKLSAFLGHAMSLYPEIGDSLPIMRDSFAPLRAYLATPESMSRS